MSADNYRDCPKCGAKEKMREDYEIYSEENTIFVEYGCYCYDCHFKFGMTHNEDFFETIKPIEIKG